MKSRSVSIHGPTGQKVSKPFARPHCPSLRLQVAGADVVGDGVAEDRVAGPRRRHVGAQPADHDRELHLVVDLAALSRQRDRVARPDDRGRRLQEEHRLRRHRPAHLGGVVGVVPADRDDLARQHRREQPARRRSGCRIPVEVERHRTGARRSRRGTCPRWARRPPPGPRRPRNRPVRRASSARSSRPAAYPSGGPPRTRPLPARSVAARASRPYATASSSAMPGRGDDVLVRRRRCPTRVCPSVVSISTRVTASVPCAPVEDAHLVVDRARASRAPGRSARQRLPQRVVERVDRPVALAGGDDALAAGVHLDGGLADHRRRRCAARRSRARTRPRSGAAARRRPRRAAAARTRRPPPRT